MNTEARAYLLQSSEALARYLVGETQWKKFDEWKVRVKKGSRGG